MTAMKIISAIMFVVTMAFALFCLLNGDKATAAFFVGLSIIHKMDMHQ
jgi:hypothetical protein